LARDILRIRNQIADFGVDRGPTTFVSAFPGPVVLEALPVPADHGRGLDDDEAFSPSIPGTSQPEPEDAVLGFQPWASALSVEDDELLAERQILCDQVGLLGEQGVDDSPDESQKEHRQLGSLLRGESAPEYTRGSSGLGSRRRTRFLVGSASSEGWHVQWE
jgi:hypothetical protein